MVFRSHSNRFSVAILWLAGLVLSTLICGPVSATNYYVRVTGNDANHGRSAALAFKTINKAASVALAGDTVYVGAGTYAEKVAFVKDGTVLAPITFIADVTGMNTGDAGVVTVNGGANPAFEIMDDNYITVSGFQATGSLGVYVVNSPGAVIHNCKIYNTTGKGVHSKTSSTRLEQCHILNGNGDALTVEGGSFDISNCLIENPNGHGISTSSITGMSTVWFVTIYSAGGSGIRHAGGTMEVFNSILSSNAAKGFELASGTLTHNYNISHSNTGGKFFGNSAGGQ